MQWRRRHQHQWVIGSARRSLLIRQSCLSSAGEGGASEEEERDHSAGEGHPTHRPAPHKTQQSERPDFRQSSWKAEARCTQERSRAPHSRPTDHHDDGYILPPEAQFPHYPCGHPIAPYPRFYYPTMPASRYRPLQPLDWFNPRVPANCQVYYTLSHPRYDGLRAVPATAVQNAYWWPFNPGVYTPCTLAPPEQATASEVTENPLIPPVTPYVYPGYAYGPAVLTPSTGHVVCRSQPPSENPPIDRTPKRKRKRKRKGKAAADNGREDDDDEASGSCCTSVTGDETTTSSVEDLNQSVAPSANGVREDMEPFPSGASGSVASLSALARRIVERAVKEAQDDVCRSDVISARDGSLPPIDITVGGNEGDGAESAGLASTSSAAAERWVDDQPMPHQERPSRDFPPLPLVNNVFAATLVDDIVSGALGIVRYLETHDSAGIKEIPQEVPAEVPAEVQSELGSRSQEELETSPASLVPAEQPMGRTIEEPIDTTLQQTQGVISEEERGLQSQLNEWSDRNGFLEEDGRGQSETELHTEIVFISETSFMDEEESRAAGCAPPLDEEDADQALDPELDKILNPDAPAFIPGDSWASTSEVDLPVRWSDDEEDEASSQQEGASVSSVSDSLKATSLLTTDEEFLKHAGPKEENRKEEVPEKTPVVATSVTNEDQKDFSHLHEEESGILDMAEELEEELGAAAARTLENYNPVRYKDYYQICSSVDVPDSPLELSAVVTRQPTRPSGSPLPAPTVSSVPPRPVLPAPSFPLGNHGEIVVHEVEDGASECGSEDVDIVGHAYEALASDTAKRHLYVNQLSLAAELLHTHQKLPYDADFKPLVTEVDDVSSAAPSSGHTNREVYENYYGNRTLMEMQEMTQMARGCREVSDSGVQSEESSDETDDMHKARRQQRATTQSSAARQPLSAVLKGKSDPLCLCCHVM